MKWFVWVLLVVGMLGFIVFTLKHDVEGKYGQSLSMRSRGSAIAAGIGGLGFLISLVGAVLNRDTAGAIRYAILLVLLTTLVLIVSRRKSDV